MIKSVDSQVRCCSSTGELSFRGWGTHRGFPTTFSHHVLDDALDPCEYYRECMNRTIDARLSASRKIIFHKMSNAKMNDISHNHEASEAPETS